MQTFEPATTDGRLALQFGGVCCAAGGRVPQHCGSAEQSCRGPETLSVKQERLVQ